MQSKMKNTSAGTGSGESQENVFGNRFDRPVGKGLTKEIEISCNMDEIKQTKDSGTDYVPQVEKRVTTKEEDMQNTLLMLKTLE